MQSLYLGALILITKIFLTLVPIAIKYTQANIWTIGLFRLLIACSFFLIFVKKSFLQDIKKIWPLGPLFFFHWITYFMAVKISTPSTAVIGLSSYGVILLFYSKYFFKTVISIGVYLSIAVAVLGTFLIVENFSFSDSNLQGLLFGLASALAYAFLPIIHQKNPLVPVRHKALAQFLGASIFFMIIGFPKANWDLTLNDYYALIYLGVGGTILGHGLWVRLSGTLSTTTTSAVYYLAIPISMVLEYLLLGIHVTERKIIGASLILGANLYILYSKKKKKA